MATFIKYELEDGGTVLIESEDEPVGGVVRAARDGGNVIINAGAKFKEALKDAKASAMALMTELNDLPIDEMEVTFGLKTTGEAGFFAVGKVGAEVTYQVTMKWKTPES